MAKCRIGTAKFFTLLLLLYRTSAKYEGTIQVWKQKVSKNKYWDEGLNNYVVQCEDGTIENP